MLASNLKFIILTVFLIMNLFSKSQVGFVNDMNMPPELYLYNFIEIANKVNKKYTHFETKEIDRDSLTNHYVSNINESLTNGEYVSLLLKYFADLNNGHSELLLPKYFIDAWACLIEDRVFIEHLYDSTLINAGVSVKDEIISIDEKPISKWLLENSVYTNASTPEIKIKWTVYDVFRSHLGGTRLFEIKTKSGIKKISIEFEKKSPSHLKLESRVTSKIIQDSIGYIDIPEMKGAAVAEFEKAYMEVSHLPFLIIDLRNNGGGYGLIAEKILKYLLKKPINACTSRIKRKPTKNNFKGKLFVLVSNDTFSAAESLVIDLKESKSAYILGLPTGGDTGNRPKRFKSKYGFYYRIPIKKKPQVSFDGFPMEGVSIEPDMIVKPLANDYLIGKDTILEFTIDLITKKYM